MAFATITRFDVFTRPATDDADEREVVRFFEKRKLIGELDMEDVARYEEFDADDFAAFVNAQPTTVDMALVYLQNEADEEEEVEGEDDEEERDSGSVVPEKYRIIYGAAQNCGDQIATALTAFVTLPRATKKDADGGLDRAKLRGVAEVNGLGDKLADWEDRGLNGGLLRMNTSNVLRGMWRRGEEVRIGDQVWPAREVEKKPRKSRAKAK